MMSHPLALLLSLIAVNLPLRYGCTDIVGGHCVRPHSWPFMAAIQRECTTVCGGVLVRKQWVLTAARCKLNESEVRVVLGAHQASIPEKEHQKFKVMQFFPHPQFDSSSNENDIMLLKLDRMASLNEYVQLLPLPDRCEDIKPGIKCKVTGWGVTSSKKPSKCLRETALTIVDRNICEKKYIKKKIHLKITSNMLCAQGWKRGACSVRSSGPLICGRQYCGIVSFGKKCGRGFVDMPGVYTRLNKKYIEWINNTISLNRE
ncbi:GRAA protein, partial [Alectura lathami]|nr:GRAA protein [Alectura lathami]